MFKKTLKLIFSMMLLIGSAFTKDPLAVVSLLRPDYPTVTNAQDFYKLVFQESLRDHLASAKNNWKNEEKYKESVYVVIPSELVRCMCKDNPYEHSAIYDGVKDENGLSLMEFSDKDGFVGLDSYTKANWNYFMLMNYFNYVFYYGAEISKEGINAVVETIIAFNQEKYGKYVEELQSAAEDVDRYMKGLDLYDYIGNLRENIPFMIQAMEQGNSNPANANPDDDALDGAALLAQWRVALNTLPREKWVSSIATFIPGFFSDEVGLDGETYLNFGSHEDRVVISVNSQGNVDLQAEMEYLKPEKTKPEETKIGCGLKNMGATCYFNSVIQFLYASEDFRTLVSQIAEQQRSPDTDSVAIILDGIFKKMDAKQDAVYVPYDEGKFYRNEHSTKDKELNRLQEIIGNSMFLGGQNDASELLYHLFDNIKEGDSNTAAPALKQLCYHKQISDVEGSCGHTSRSVVFEPLLDLGMSGSSNSFDLESLVSEETSKKENLVENNQWMCDECAKKKVNAKKSTSIELPETLIVHLKRFAGRWKDSKGNSLTADEESKIKSFRDASGNFLCNYIDREGSQEIVTKDMSKICDPVEYKSDLQIGNVKYRLRATIHHRGSLSFGHYWAKAFTPGGTYYEANDSNVTKLTFTEPTEYDKKTVYLLMYERVKERA